MRKACAYILITAFVFAACSPDRLDPGQTGKRSGLSVYVATGDPDTKADFTQGLSEGGETDMNENVIRTLDFFFFPKGSEGGTATPLEHRFVADAGNDVQIRYDWIEGVDDRTFLQSIFGSSLDNGSECEAYVIVNLWTMSGGDRVSLFQDNWATQTHATLRSTVIQASDNTHGFNQTGSQKEDQFVMEGSSLITLNVRNGRLFVEGEIPVYRAAAKMRLQVTVPDDIIANGVVDAAGYNWTPRVEFMKVILVNGVNKGYVSAFDETYMYNVLPADVFPNCFYGDNQEDWWTYYAHEMPKKSGSDGTASWTEEDPDTHASVTKTGSVFEHEVPFYSYRTKNWKGEPDNEAYLLLLLPWRREEKPTGENVPYLYTNTYYQIPIAQDRTAPEYRLKSNRYYRQEVKVSILGSFSIEDLVTLTPNTFIVLDWGQSVSGDPTESEVKMSHTAFLAVGNNQVEMNNIPSASVEYSSSHDVTANITKLEFYSYYDANNTDRYLRVVYERQKNAGVLTNTWSRSVYDGETGAEIRDYRSNNAGDPCSTNTEYKGFPLGSYSVNTDNGLITLTHAIPDSQFSKAVITVEVTNEAIDTPEKIEFTQYPGIYITGHRSNSYVFVNGRGNTSNSRVQVYDDRNNNNGRIGSLEGRSAISGAGTNNNNRNLYTIHISSFNSGSNYILGDPRTTEAVTLANLSGTNGKYHPTDSSYPTVFGQDYTENMISPEFLIASSYGKVNSNYYMTYDQAKKRCAAYQEDGYPAGRWRMPTKAEVLYMMELSQGNKIPSLFNFYPDGYGNDLEGYWCANGKVVTQNNNLGLANNETKTAVRCVYDVWYWGSDPYQENATNWLGYQY